MALLACVLVCVCVCVWVFVSYALFPESSEFMHTHTRTHFLHSFLRQNSSVQMQITFRKKRTSRLCSNDGFRCLRTWMMLRRWHVVIELLRCSSAYHTFASIRLHSYTHPCNLTLVQAVDPCQFGKNNGTGRTGRASKVSPTSDDVERQSKPNEELQ